MTLRQVRWPFFYAWLIVLSAWTLCNAACTPLLTHSDPDIQREFTNIYQTACFPQISTGTAQNFTIVNGTSTALSVTTATLTTATISTGTLPSFMVVGSNTNVAAPTGRLGEYMCGSTLRSAATGLANGTFKTVASIPITAGDWEVRAMGGFLSTNAGTSVTNVTASISLTDNARSALDTAAVPSANGETFVDINFAAVVPGNGNSIIVPVPPSRVSISVGATYYLTIQAGFTVSTMSGYGSICARRVK